jgi:hypothetical protein
MFGLALPLLVVGLVIWLVRSRHHPGSEGESSTVDLRRLLRFGALFGTLVATSVGVARLLTYAWTEDLVGTERADLLALGLALTLVATPLFVFLARRVVVTLRSDPVERASVVYGLYLVAASLGALVVAVVAAIRVGDGWLGVEPYEPGALALLAVAVPVWFLHLVALRHHELAPTSDVPLLGTFAGSTVGLVALAVGVGGSLRAGLGELYWAAFGPPMFEPTSDLMLHSLVVVAVAAPVWWWYWLHEGRGEYRETLWQAYVLLVAVLGGMATAVAGAGVALATTLEWFIGDPFAVRAPAHFAALVPALAAVTVGTSVWAYHRRVLASATPPRTEPERAYEYLSAVVGLVAAAVGITATVVALVEAIVPASLVTSAPLDRGAVVTALTLLIVGTPVWAAFWWPIQRRAHAEPAIELRAPSRRVALTLVFGASAAVTAVSSVVFLFVALRDLIDGALGYGTLYELRVAAGLIVTGGAIAAYHWAVHREDRSLAPPPPPSLPPPPSAAHPYDVLLVGPDGAALASIVAADTGAHVRSLHRVDGPHLEVDGHRVAEAILAVHHPNVVVTIDHAGDIDVIPYEPA